MRGQRLFPAHSLLGAALLVLVSGCGVATGGSEAPHSAVPPAELVMVASEPTGWSQAAFARCGGLAFDARTACYDELLIAVLRTAGVGAAMETLEQIGALDPETNHHGHVLAHHIGIAAYRSPEQVGAVFAGCRPSFQSGCYHGVIQAYFADVQASSDAPHLGTERLNGLCQDYRGEDGDHWLLFQCVHGIGHGLLALYDNHLPQALEGCDRLEVIWEREGCYGGAFMENIVSATQPHHAPRPAHATAHDHGDPHAHGDAETEPHEHPDHVPGHDHATHGDPHPSTHAAQPANETTATATEFRQLDPGDPHYPCSVLDERYQYACYSMQTSAVLFWSQGDISAGVRLCDQAPERVRAICYVSLGRDINAYSQQRHAVAADKCQQVPDAFQPNCLVGVAKNLIDLSADPEDGSAFCRSLAPGRNRERCFQAVGEQVAVLEPSPERRAEYCDRLADLDARACRFGAGVANGGLVERSTRLR